MSELDIRALEANFHSWKADRAPALEESKAFERYAVDQVLKDRDLSDEEIAYGNLGGVDDGGVDAFHLFIGDQHIQDESTPPPQAKTVELVLLQGIARSSLRFATLAQRRGSLWARMSQP
jgi:hypothetical protein